MRKMMLRVAQGKHRGRRIAWRKGILCFIDRGDPVPIEEAETAAIKEKAKPSQDWRPRFMSATAGRRF